MKTFADESWQREIEAYEQFRYLWQTGDQAWLEQRKQNWRRAYEDSGGDPHTLARGKFYVSGEEPPRIDGGVEIQFNFKHRIAYTPFQTVDQVKEYWQSTLEIDVVGARRKHESFRFLGETLARFPERDLMVKLVSETLFSPDYFMCLADSKSKSPGKLCTIHPRDFVFDYADVSPFYHQSNRHEWDYRNFSIDYFILCVRHCEENNLLAKPGGLRLLPDMYAYLLGLDDTCLSAYRLELKQKLIGRAEADDAPGLLRKALDGTRSRLRR